MGAEGTIFCTLMQIYTEFLNCFQKMLVLKIDENALNPNFFCKKLKTCSNVKKKKLSTIFYS